MSRSTDEKTEKSVYSDEENQSIDNQVEFNTDRIQVDNVLAEMEKALNDIATDNPRVVGAKDERSVRLDDLKAILEISVAINSSLVLDETLQVLMLKAVELLSAERGFIMLLDDNEELQFKTAYNLCKEEMMEEDFKISNSIANRVARTGKSVYTSDAQNDERYASQKSVVELHLRSIMCVPLKINQKVIGIIYLDNSSQAKLFLKSDLYLFELLAQQAALAIHHAQLYQSQIRLKRYYEQVIDQSPVGIIVIDDEYNVVTINDASLEIFQIDKEGLKVSVTGKDSNPFFDLVPDSEEDKWRAMITEVLVGKGSVIEDRYFHKTKYEEKALSIKIIATSNLPGRSNGAILVVEDITEKVILEKYVILSEKLVAKGEMAASIGHELNNYLTIISNNAELMQLNIEKGSYDKVNINVDRVLENISKIKRFTDGLMDFSKLETETIDYDIKHLIEDLLFSLKTHNRFSDVEIDVSFAPRLPTLLIDVGQIQQVLLNLLNNAVDAMEKAEEKRIKISVKLDRKQNMMAIVVSDTGHGMSKETMGRLFQPHFTTKSRGHGLGLSNCRKIIHNHGGEIEVDSTEGEGSTFTVKLPLVEKAQAK